MIRGGVGLLAFGLKIGLSLLAAWVVSLPLIPMAAKERGYEGAYGGEWL
ncbi:MAG: hypothetical protein LBC86_03930 [Oscillospiraceae bacterium]|nr:hypothetical protein [Oscillospiraceae bacterium]